MACHKVDIRPLLCRSVLVRPIYGYAISIVMYVISTTYSERIFSQAKCEIMCQVCRVIMQSMATCRPKILIGTKEISLNNVRTTLGVLVKNATRTVKFISARGIGADSFVYKQTIVSIQGAFHVRPTRKICRALSFHMPGIFREREYTSFIFDHIKRNC